MGPEELEELLFDGRTYSVRLTLSSGDVIVVRSDEPVLFRTLTLLLPARARGGRMPGPPRLVSLPNMAMAELGEPRAGQARRRR